ncbi:hypothetical protein POTOM_016021 [Populus tomentosa]|uniref:Uncharacterized protein n=1 Tax=Populus tomentosa TaxID=118781 RepID=A0A8X8A873_POPTO|nr:hypothetical protein POTOM_016021 [Populus tomentosa]
MATKTELNFSLLSSLTFIILAIPIHAFLIKVAKLAFKQNQLTSRKLGEFYIGEINRLNSFLKGVIEINPEALRQADKADDELSVGAPGIVVKLREAGAIILEKASLSG